jgi:glycosyltransferase involved in cell wall biosynthesis
MNNTRILFICRERLSAYGNSIGLVNSAQFLATYLSEHYKMQTKVVTVVDSNGIDKEVHAFKPSHVVIHALWVPGYKLLQLLPKYPKVQWIVRIHSKIPFLANEGIAVEWLKEYQYIQKKCHNLIISANSVECTDALNLSMDLKCVYLPNIYDPIEPRPKPIKDPKHLDIGCFGAIRPMKNQLIQAMAAIAFGNDLGKKIRFHINASRTEQKGDTVLKNLRALFKNTGHELVEHGWLDHKDFLKLISTMDIGLQVSLTETFNIVAGDFVHCGIPIVVSDEISWMPCYAQANPHDIYDIVAKLHNNVDSKWFKTWLNRKALNRSNRIAGEIWGDYLRRS